MHRLIFCSVIHPTVVVYPHTNIIGNIIKHNLRISMNERTHVFIKICISYTLFSKGLMFLLCVREEWRLGGTAILTQLLLLTIARCVIFKNPLSTSSASWLELFNRGCWSSLWPFLSQTHSTAAGTCLHSFVMPTSASSSAYLHRCISD